MTKPQNLSDVWGIDLTNDYGKSSLQNASKDLHERITHRVSNNLREGVVKKLDSKRTFTPKEFLGMYRTDKWNFAIVYKLSNTWNDDSKFITVYVDKEWSLLSFKDDSTRADNTLDKVWDSDYYSIPEVKLERKNLWTKRWYDEFLYVNWHNVWLLIANKNYQYDEDSWDEIEIFDAKDTFIKLLKRTPLNNYHDGSLWESYECDTVTLMYEDGKTLTLACEGKHGSNYAHSDTTYFYAESTIIQLVKLIWEHGKPKSIDYKYAKYSSWAGQNTINYNAEGEFWYNEVEQDIIKEMLTLDKWSDMNEIYTTLKREDEELTKERNINHFQNLLWRELVDKHRDGSLGSSHELDHVTLVFDDKEIVLDGTWEHWSNHAHTETIYYKSEPMINQIDKIIAENGNPKSIKVEISWHNSRQGAVQEDYKRWYEYTFEDVEEIIKNTPREIQAA